MENSNYISKLISTDSYLVVNKTLIKKIGLIPASLLCELCSEYNYYEKNNMLLNGSYFYSTQKNITENIGISRFQQENAIKELVKLGLLEVKVMGMPSKRYFSLYFDKIEQLLKNNNFIDKNDDLSDIEENDENAQKTLKNQGCEKLTTKDVSPKNLEKSRLLETDNQGCKKVANKDVRKQQPRLQETDNQGCEKVATKSNNNNNNKKLINNNLIISQIEDESDEMKQYHNFIYKIDLKNLYKSYQNQNNKKAILNNILDIINDIYVSDKQYYFINGNHIPKINFIAQLDKYNFETIDYLVESFSNNNSEIKNIKAYMLSSIYNAPKTIDLYYYNKMKKDMVEIN